MVNQAGIRWKEWSLNGGGLTDVRMFFSEVRSKACCEKSADAIVDTDTSLRIHINLSLSSSFTCHFPGGGELICFC
jgi:hypothetical protein